MNPTIPTLPTRLPGHPARPRRAREAPLYHPATDYEAARQLTLAIAREIDNLLGGISGLSEIFQQGPDGNQKLTEVFALIHKSSNRLRTLIAHLKLLHRRATGEVTYLNLSRTVRGLFEMFAPLLSVNTSVEMDLPPEELAIHLDEARLRRVLLNLTLNLRDALRVHRAAAGKLRVGIRFRSDAVAQLTLAAEDDSTGGMDDAPPPDADARARLSDARECLGEMGGSFTRRTDTEFVLELPVVVTPRPSFPPRRHV